MTDSDALKYLKKIPMPSYIKPMLAVLVKESFNDPDWIFEIKWDGYRAIATIKKGKVELISRNNKSFNHRFPQIVEVLQELHVESAILDGEIVILDSSGKSQFQLMQNYQRTQKGKVRYCVFDLLYLDGYDLRKLPLIARKKVLKELLKRSKLSKIIYSEHVDAKGIAFFKKAQKKLQEGIMAKRSDSIYESKRSTNWLKIKTHMRQEAVIAGFTSPRGSRKKFGALLLGVYDSAGEFQYIGHVGGGFSEKLLQEVYDKLAPLVQSKCPFKSKPKTNMPAIWIKPKLVCEVSFAEWTDEGLLRQPIFQGLRFDKKASAVKREKFVPLGSVK